MAGAPAAVSKFDARALETYDAVQEAKAAKSLPQLLAAVAEAKNAGVPAGELSAIQIESTFIKISSNFTIRT